MKLVAILGSPRGMSGNTGAVLAGVLQGARAGGADVTTFSLAELSVQPCNGCEVCHKTGDCPITDDFAPILTAMKQADGIVLASPNYIHSVTAQLKALLDRCSSLVHLQSMVGKYAAAVVTSGGDDDEGVDSYLLLALRTFGYATVGSLGVSARQLFRPDTREATLASATTLGVHLVDAIRTRQPFPEQDAARRVITERMRQLVTMRKEEWTYEYAIWKERSEKGEE